MAGVKLSEKGFEYVYIVMSELDIERPDAIRLAFAKGITDDNIPDMERRGNKSEFEFPISVVAKGDDMLLVKHLIIEKIKKRFDAKKLGYYILMFVEHGLEIMYKEIQSLSEAENYLLYLQEKHVSI